uniref:Uncharacterized protein n=1 Tax=Onchocerca volvulus TaxID=6282 RepID=A0A8R1XWC7_ONCVO
MTINELQEENDIPEPRQAVIVSGSGAAINDIRKMSLTKSKTTLHNFEHLVKEKKRGKECRKRKTDEEQRMKDEGRGGIVVTIYIHYGTYIESES